MGERYKVSIKRKVERQLKKLPKNAQKTLALLIQDLAETGPIPKAWSNFSALGPSRYHCHLSVELRGLLDEREWLHGNRGRLRR